MGAEEEQKGRSSGDVGNEARQAPISVAQFLSWKLQKDVELATRKAEAARKRAEDIAAGVVQMNGRELFIHEPSLFDNDRY